MSLKSTISKFFNRAVTPIPGPTTEYNEFLSDRIIYSDENFGLATSTTGKPYNFETIDQFFRDSIPLAIRKAAIDSGRTNIYTNHIYDIYTQETQTRTTDAHDTRKKAGQLGGWSSSSDKITFTAQNTWMDPEGKKNIVASPDRIKHVTLHEFSHQFSDIFSLENTMAFRKALDRDIEKFGGMEAMRAEGHGYLTPSEARPNRHYSESMAELGAVRFGSINKDALERARILPEAFQVTNSMTSSVVHGLESGLAHHEVRALVDMSYLIEVPSLSENIFKTMTQLTLKGKEQDLSSRTNLSLIQKAYSQSISGSGLGSLESHYEELIILKMEENQKKFENLQSHVEKLPAILEGEGKLNEIYPWLVDYIELSDKSDIGKKASALHVDIAQKLISAEILVQNQDPQSAMRNHLIESVIANGQKGNPTSPYELAASREISYKVTRQEAAALVNDHLKTLPNVLQEPGYPHLFGWTEKFASLTFSTDHLQYLDKPLIEGIGPQLIKAGFTELEDDFAFVETSQETMEKIVSKIIKASSEDDTPFIQSDIENYKTLYLRETNPAALVRDPIRLNWESVDDSEGKNLIVLDQNPKSPVGQNIIAELNQQNFNPVVQKLDEYDNRNVITLVGQDAARFKKDGFVMLGGEHAPRDTRLPPHHILDRPLSGPVIPSVPHQNISESIVAATVQDRQPLPIATDMPAAGRLKSTFFAVAEHGTKGAVIGLSGYGVATKLGGMDENFTADRTAGGERAAYANLSLASDIGGFTADAIESGADTIAKRAARTAASLENPATVSGIGKMAGVLETGGGKLLVSGAQRLALPLALAAGGFEVAAAIKARDPERAAGAVGGTLGGLAAGAAFGALGGSIGGPPGAILGGIVGGVAGAIVGEKVVKEVGTNTMAGLMGEKPPRGEETTGYKIGRGIRDTAKPSIDFIKKHPLVLATGPLAPVIIGVGAVLETNTGKAIVREAKQTVSAVVTGGGSMLRSARDGITSLFTGGDDKPKAAPDRLAGAAAEMSKNQSWVRHADRNGDGKVSSAELRRSMAGHGQNEAGADKNHDGRITAKETAQYLNEGIAQERREIAIDRKAYDGKSSDQLRKAIHDDNILPDTVKINGKQVDITTALKDPAYLDGVADRFEAMHIRGDHDYSKQIGMLRELQERQSGQTIATQVGPALTTQLAR